MDNSELETASEFGEKLVQLISELFSSSRTAKAHEASQRFVTALKKNLGLKACSLYSVFPGSAALTLEAQAGMSYDLYQSFELDRTKLAARVLDGKVLTIPDVRGRTDYRDIELIKKFNLKSAVFVGVPYPEELDGIFPNESCCAVLCLYPETDDQAKFVETVARLIQPVLGQIFANCSHHRGQAQQSLQSSRFDGATARRRALGSKNFFASKLNGEYSVKSLRTSRSGCGYIPHQ